MGRFRRDATTRSRRLALALGLNVVVLLAQVVLGFVAHSLGLLSDAGHNLTDVAALALSLVAVRLARRAPTADRSFGWHRGTILAAQANAVMILLITVWISYEAIRRLIHPPEVEGGVVLVVALVAFVANAAAALIVSEPHGGGTGDLNMRSAMLHLVSDAAASVGVAAAGAVMAVTGGWNRLDPAISLVIAVSIAWHAWVLLRSANAVLLEGAPRGLDLGEVAAAMLAFPSVETVHDLHVWSLSSEVTALSAHLVIDGDPTLEEAQAVGAKVRRLLAERFRITHSTLELECDSCEDLGPACDIEHLVPGAPTPPVAHHH